MDPHMGAAATGRQATVDREVCPRCRGVERLIERRADRIVVRAVDDAGLANDRVEDAIVVFRDEGEVDFFADFVYL